MSDYPNERDCEHGHLRRSCEICELQRELAEANATIQRSRDKWNADAHRAARLEGQLAYARECLREAMKYAEYGEPDDETWSRWRVAVGLGATSIAMAIIDAGAYDATEGPQES